MKTDFKVGQRVRVLSATSREAEIGEKLVNRWPAFCETGTVARLDHIGPFRSLYVFVSPDQYGADDCRFYPQDLDLVDG